VNLCTGCGQDFASVEAFDAHRVGKFPQTGPAEYRERLSRGLVDPLDDWQPGHGRRCLNTDEMLATGWTKDGRGRWIHPAGQAARLRVRAWYSAQDATESRRDRSTYLWEIRALREFRDTCPVCAAALRASRRGRRPIYCSPVCRKRAQRRRKAAG
jgi:hypothetical protein